MKRNERTIGMGKIQKFLDDKQIEFVPIIETGSIFIRDYVCHKHAKKIVSICDEHKLRYEFNGFLFIHDTFCKTQMK